MHSVGRGSLLAENLYKYTAISTVYTRKLETEPLDWLERRRRKDRERTKQNHGRLNERNKREFCVFGGNIVDAALPRAGCM